MVTQRRERQCHSRGGGVQYSTDDKQHQIGLVLILPCLTATLRPGDNGPNKAFKCALRRAFELWRADEVARRTSAGEDCPANINMQWTLIKGPHVYRIECGIQHLQGNPDIVVNGW